MMIALSILAQLTAGVFWGCTFIECGSPVCVLGQCTGFGWWMLWATITTLVTPLVNFVVARRLSAVVPIAALGLLGPLTTMAVTAQQVSNEDVAVALRVAHTLVPFMVLNLTCFLPSWLGLALGHLRAFTRSSGSAAENLH